MVNAGTVKNLINKVGRRIPGSVSDAAEKSNDYIIDKGKDFLGRMKGTTMGSQISEDVGKINTKLNGYNARATNYIEGDLGDDLSAIGDTFGTFNFGGKGLAAIGIGAFALGVADVAAPAAKDAALETAFGTEEADRYFTGRDLDSRFLLGASMGGVVGGAMQLTAPTDYLNVAAPLAADPVIEGGIGAGIGGMLGARKGVRGAIAGGLVGGAIGTAEPFNRARMRVSNNNDFYKNSPYARSSSSQTAADLSAVGDIVLGMHNARSGY